jgi:hypothetical protein
VFAFAFAKNDMANLEDDEAAVFRKAAKLLRLLTDIKKKGLQAIADSRRSRLARRRARFHIAL